MAKSIVFQLGSTDLTAPSKLNKHRQSNRRKYKIEQFDWFSFLVSDDAVQVFVTAHSIVSDLKFACDFDLL